MNEETDEFRFLGLKASEIIELKSRAEADGVLEILKENAALRAKVSYYESRIGDMARFAELIQTK